MTTQYTIVVQNGRPYKVPVEHAKKFVRKNMLVEQAIGLKDLLKRTDITFADRFDAESELRTIMSKIIRINRQIPPCAIPL